MKKALELFTIAILLGSCRSGINEEYSKADSERNASHSGLSGIVIEKHPLTVRFVDNSERYFHISDSYAPGMNGIASLIHADQCKNIFSTVGMNLEGTHTIPPAGKLKDVGLAPRVGAIQMEQIDSVTVKYTQVGADVAGLNMEIVFKVGDSYIDQTITTWPDHDIEFSSSFFASYMNQVQNTSIFLRTPGENATDKQWLEIASAGHGADDGIGVFGRPYDPYGMRWQDHLKDNPLLRQGIYETPKTKQATFDAGFSKYSSKKMDYFYYGLVDDYLYLMIFREADFIFWISASGSKTRRSPAWDYEFKTGPQLANERRDFHVRLVYKPFVSIEDILEEVDRFQNENIEN